MSPCRLRRPRGNRAALLLLLGVMAPSAAAAQKDSVSVVAGEVYATGSLRGTLLGRDYRDLWTTAIRLPLLDLGAYAGGLTPVERGSGLQTRSLRFRGSDGLEYNFRSVDKDQTGGLHPDFQNTFIDHVAQDQVSSKHPAGGLITSALLKSAGVLHAEPRLFVMPDDARLGEFREEFAGMLGMVEVHANEGHDGAAGFAGASRVADGERLLEHLQESPEHRADAREYLRARLVDLLVGDWDRHLGQWRWGRYGREGAYVWVPIPEDRDNALSSFDGILLGMARSGAPHLNEFTAYYPPLFGLTRNAQVLDRQILSELEREDFDAMAAEVQRRLPDSVLEQAVASTPPEYFALRGQELIGKLKTRRDALPQAARAFYEQLAREVDVWATDEPEVALVERLPNRSVELRLFAADEFSEGRPYFRRRFLPGETREIRVHLRGGDDRGVVRGDSGESLLVRLVGGAGDDVLVDSSGTSGNGRTVLYDASGDNRFETSRATIVDVREFVAPVASGSGFNDNAPGARDWGVETHWFRPWAEWRYNVGPVIGGGPRFTRYGFRRTPYAQQIGLRALWAPLHTRFGLEVDGDFRRTNSPYRLSFNGAATQLEVTRFHGFGNETSDEGSSDNYKVWGSTFRAAVGLHRGLGERSELSIGPTIQYRRPDPDPDGPAAATDPFGSAPFAEVGAFASATIDTRDLPSFPRRGVHALLSTTAYPGIWDAPGAFGGANAAAATYLPVPFPLETTLALRAGGGIAWGDYPFQEASYVGGSRSLRGFSRQRFAGDAAAFGGLEVRTFLTRFNFISRGDLGVIGLADAGRVFLDGESSDRWHTSFGGGLWVGILDRNRTASLVFAQGDEQSLYFSIGMPF